MAVSSCVVCENNTLVLYALSSNSELRNNMSMKHHQRSTTERGFVASSTGVRGRLAHNGPYRVATACLTAFCLILLMVLVAMGVHYNSMGQNSQKVSQNSTSSSSTQMQKACANVTTLIAEQSRLKEKNIELQNELDQLKAKTEKLETTPTPQPVQCTDDWLYFNGSCYFISRFGRSWMESQKYCERKGGHLAIIHTAEEQVRENENTHIYLISSHLI
uniref:C-type lectin domain-containing protein n=1 Tax=Astyanax mexicanus TaxID=7994 RepID=A0A8B9LXW0_ASTMX